MIALLTMHLGSLSRDRSFHRALLFYVFLLAGVMLLLTYRLMRQEWFSTSQGNLLYRELTLAVLLLTLFLQPHRVWHRTLRLEPQGRWGRLAYPLFVPVVNTLIFMMVGVPFYVLAVYTGGARIGAFAAAACLMLILSLFIASIQLAWPARRIGATGFAYAIVLVLGVAPWWVIHLPLTNQTPSQIARIMSIPWAIWQLFSDHPSKLWMTTSLVHVLVIGLLWLSMAIRSRSFESWADQPMNL